MATKFIITIIISLTTYISFAQQYNYSSSGCTEITTDSTYSLIRGQIELEKGSYLDKQRNGLWISKNIKGTIIRKANYKNGILDGSYETFYFDGKTKITASFKNGLPDGNWTYFNNKGKIIKKGSFLDGKPINIWNIYDKKGNKVLYAYDFQSMKEIASSNGSRYNSGMWIPQDSQSGEYILFYKGEKTSNSTAFPLGGYELASDFFNINFTIPFQLTNTINTLDFVAQLKVEDSIIKSISINESKADNSPLSLQGLLHFFASTNKKSKLKQETPSANTILFIKDQLKETILLAGPWLINKPNENNFKIQLPIVINDIKQF